MKNYKNLT